MESRDHRTELLYQAGESSDNDGGDITHRGGFINVAGKLHGGVRWQFHNGVTGDTHLQLIEVASGQRILSILLGADLTAAKMPANTGDKVLYVAEAASTPTADPVGGAIVFNDAGVMKYRDPSGNEITI